MRDHEEAESGKAKKQYIVCDCETGNHEQLYNGYFAENPTYGEVMLQSWFRMRRPLYLDNANAVEARDP